jgi:hypothetical protein
MCHGHVDPGLLDREVRDRWRAAERTRRPARAAEDSVSPDLARGRPGLLARLRTMLTRRPRIV